MRSGEMAGGARRLWSKGTSKGVVVLGCEGERADSAVQWTQQAFRVDDDLHPAVEAPSIFERRHEGESEERKARSPATSRFVGVAPRWALAGRGDRACPATS